MKHTSRLFFERFPDPVLVADPQRIIVYRNPAADRLLEEVYAVGEMCPICSQLPVLMRAGADRKETGRCLMRGETLNRIPIRIETKRRGLLSLTATVSPLYEGEEVTGCFVVLRDLEEDLGAHPAIQLQTATLSSILEHFPTPFFTVDPNLVVTHINRPMEELTGYRRGEVVGKMTCGTVLNTIQCDTEACILREVMRKRIPISGLRRVVRNRSGKEIQVVVAASIITDPAGNVIGGFEAIRDITPMVEAERKIELLTELTKEGILMVDEHQRILFANARMAGFVGRPKDELIGMHLGDVLTPEHVKMAAELTARADQTHLQEREFCSALNGFPVTEAPPRVFETCMAASRVGKKPLTCIYLRDLSDRIQIERELHKANSFLTNIIQSSVNGIVVVNTNGVPLIFNEGAERILGYRAHEVIGHPEVLRRIYPPEVATEMMSRMRSDRFGPPDKLNPTQVTFRNKQGEEVPVNFSAAIIREGGREIASVGIFSDLREHLKMIKKLEEMQMQLMQAEKIASLGRLAAGVAHEINNPLAGILIYAEMLLRNTEPDSQNRADVEEIIAQTERCREIVTRLLEFSRQSLGQSVLFDVNALIERCVELLARQSLFHNIEIVRDLQPDLPHLQGDRGQLEQVFTNLMLNAADAMQGEGKITITTRFVLEEERLLLTFSDTGPGIPPEIVDKIFDPFFTTKPPGKGTGLGLSVVYGVLQRHGGTIEVDSTPGSGTTFVMTLPLRALPEAEPDREHAAGLFLEE